MEKTLSDYDKSLDALDKEKERLENVMRLMGEEWAERYGDLHRMHGSFFSFLFSNHCQSTFH
jgi:hypothetical protein